MLRTRFFGNVALFLLVVLAGCRHCSSGSKSASASCPHVATGSPPCASCAARAAAPIPGLVER